MKIPGYIERRLVKKLKKDDYSGFAKEFKTLDLYNEILGLVLLNLRKRNHPTSRDIIESDTFEIADKIIAVVEKKAITEKIFQVNEAGEIEAYFKKDKSYGPFVKWLCGVTINLCIDKVSYRREVISLNGEINIGEAKLQLKENISEPNVLDPLAVPMIEEEIKQKLMNLVHDLAEFAQSVKEIRPRNIRSKKVALVLIEYIRWNIFQFIELPLSNEEWRGFEFRDLDKANLLKFGLTNIDKHGKLNYFKPKETWHWIQNNLDDVPLSKDNRYKVKERFRKTMDKLNPNLLKDLYEVGLIEGGKDGK